MDTSQLTRASIIQFLSHIFLSLLPNLHFYIKYASLHITRLGGFKITAINDEYLHSHFIYCHRFLDTAAGDSCENNIQIPVTYEIYKRREMLFTVIF